MSTERVGTAVIGGGQAGLAVGHHLAQRRGDFVILEAGLRLGDSWRARWDSLRLFTPAHYSHLPGLACPAGDGRFQTKDEMAHYLEAYAAHFELPVQLGRRADRVVRANGRYLITGGGQAISADHVVVATGAFTTPYIPEFTRWLDRSINQLHSTDYRNPGQLLPGASLVVGAGNSGAEIAVELAEHHNTNGGTWLAGRDTGHVPFTLGNASYRLMNRLSVGSWPGRTIASSGVGRGHPLIRVRPKDLVRAGVQRVGRVLGVSDGLPVLAGGRVLKVENIVWCTGFRYDFAWIDLPVFDDHGAPLHRRGIVQAEPGLYFIGLPFQSSVASHLVGGVGADAKRIADAIATRPKAP